MAAIPTIVVRSIYTRRSLFFHLETQEDGYGKGTKRTHGRREGWAEEKGKDRTTGPALESR